MSALNLALDQASLPGFCPITKAVEAISFGHDPEERGAIFTKVEVVEFILDLCGYTIERPLQSLRLLEPSFGAGDFLLPAIKRLLDAWKVSESKVDAFTDIADCIRAVEIHHETYRKTKKNIINLLESYGISSTEANAISNKWLVLSDFLLSDIDGEFDFVIGNPPYVRQELIPSVLLNEYKNRYKTIYGRADLYVPFIECSLRLLRDGGVLGFICADRWMKNSYGGPLRSLVSSDFNLRVYVDMSGTQAFHSDVTAYPAVTVIAKDENKKTRIAKSPEISRQALRSLAKELCSSELMDNSKTAKELPKVCSGADPWILDGSERMSLLRRLEESFPLIESAGCKVGIGVATGADKAFIGRYEDLDVEPDRKLRLATTKDIQAGTVVWQGLGVVNPFKDGPGSGLVCLDDYPLLKKYMESKRSLVENRHIAKKNPSNWYRTIDRITESLSNEEKLLIPDINGNSQIVFENGFLYPHHNLYYITSKEWDLRSLQAVLLSNVAKLFISSYTTKMRGGFLRFQAQYIRRIRIPKWNQVPFGIRKDLMTAAESMDIEKCNKATFNLFNLTEEEIEAINGDRE